MGPINSLKKLAQELDNSMQFPVLTKLISEKLVWLDGNEYVGQASDGAEISLGNQGSEEGIERYLKANPSPEDW